MVRYEDQLVEPSEQEGTLVTFAHSISLKF
jgi:hypothetical protein